MRAVIAAWRARPLTWMLAVGALAAGAYTLVYSGGAAGAGVLRGRVLLAAGLGGWALAFTPPLLVLLVPLATTVWLGAPERPSGPRWPWAPPALFLAGFSLTFVVAIGGVPDPLARAIYRAHHPLGEVTLGGLLLLWGLAVTVRVPSHVRARAGSYAAGLGVAMGLVRYHELDPSFDSVFFATGNAVASSHAPLTVAVFSTALSVLHFVVAATASRWRLPAARALAGAGTVVLGAAVAGSGLGTAGAILPR
ncbi:MAG TPA: hypothetical protein DDZ42_17140 [Candidatus Rokubacteria bacterium]|nr:MAG: hypothetical protein A2050_01040 [Candidatus Rokubacteria bacterium GWA2_73_35]HBH03617.1 hypothetical protein [Candidatus Rokubacteria bacterium]